MEENQLMFWKWIGTFIDIHWGDLNGMFLIISGAIIVMKAGDNANIFALGSSLVVSGASLLRLKPGNGVLGPILNNGKGDGK